MQNQDNTRAGSIPESLIPPEIITIKQASERTGLSYSHIRKLCLSKKIVCFRAGAKWLVNFPKFIDYLNTGE